MDWSCMFAAEVVVLGCGNILFGDDGLAPRAVAFLAAGVEESRARGESSPFDHVAFMDAGTSVRPLLMDLTLHQAPRLRRVVVVDVVQEKGREAGSLRLEDMQCHSTVDPAGGFLHHAPTWALLRTLKNDLHVDVCVLTVQAARIPERMDDALSPEAERAFPELLARVRALCLSA